MPRQESSTALRLHCSISQQRTTAMRGRPRGVGGARPLTSETASSQQSMRLVHLQNNEDKCRRGLEEQRQNDQRVGERERERERKLTCHHKSTKSPEASFGNAPSTAPSRARQSLPRRQPKRELWPNDSSFFPVFFLGGAVSGVKGL